ncbi:MAG TPA: hypothetical protein VMV18_06560, partial [bacterium]|nr:hypothetical protein [bacterium]
MGMVGDSYRVMHDRAAERRGIALRAIDALDAGASEADLCRRVATSLVANEEVPFALVYLVDGSRGARLAAAAGVESDTRWSPRFLALDAADAWPVEHVIATGEPVELGQLEARFGARPAGIAREVRGARLVAIRGRGSDRVRGVLVVGLGAEEPGSFLRTAAERLAAALGRASARAEAL